MHLLSMLCNPQYEKSGGGVVGQVGSQTPHLAHHDLVKPSGGRYKY